MISHLIQILQQQLKIISTQMMQQNSSAIQPQKQSQQINQRKVQKNQLPFYKNPIISFVKVGHCHMCKSRSKIVYQCHRNFQATSCEKKFCLDCLILIYKQNVIQSLQKSDIWRCPYNRKVCRCKNCCTTRKQQYSVLQLDTNTPVYSNLRNRAKQQQISLSVNNEQESEQIEIDESTRCLLKQKFKKVLELNGQMINKVNTYYHKLTEEQIKFYNKLIHSNLKVMNHLAQNMIAHQTITEQ